MSPLVDNTQAGGGPRLRVMWMDCNLARAVGPALICGVMLTGCSAVQPSAKPAAEAPVCTESEVRYEGAGQPGLKTRLDPGLVSVLEADGITIIDDDDQDPRPQWYCFEPEVEIDPIWPGTPLTHTFEICNLGTANLNIGAKGG